MNKERPISGLNLHFITLLTMMDDFKQNSNIYKYFEDKNDDNSFMRANLLKYKIQQILNRMVDYSYYYDIDTVSVDFMMTILKNAFAYIEELEGLSAWKLDKEE